MEFQGSHTLIAERVQEDPDSGQHDDLPNPLLLEGWLQFNKEQWGLEPHRLRLTSGSNNGSWTIETVFYTDRKGRIVQPPLNPHLPIRFSTPAVREGARGRRWRQAAGQLASVWKTRGLRGSVCLPPACQDVRPWTWNGFVARPCYTYYLVLPLAEQALEDDVRNKVRKARRAGYSCDVTQDFEGIIECLKAPESRKGFSHHIEADGLARMHRCLGDRNFLAVGCFSSAGEMVAARVAVFEPGGLALDLMAGVKSKALRDGVNALLTIETLRFLHERDVCVFDFAGANIPSVAAMKEAWGGRLVTYFSLSQRNLRHLLREGLGVAEEAVSLLGDKVGALVRRNAHRPTGARASHEEALGRLVRRRWKGAST